MTRRRGATLLAGLALAAGLGGCASADPAAVAAVGLDADGYLAVVQLCDQGRSFTYAQFSQEADGAPSLAWIGRTVEPITFYRIGADPPDNWVVDVDGGLVSGVEYTFAATAEDLRVTGPPVTLADLNDLTAGQVIDAGGAVRTIDDFLDHACGA